MVCVLDEHKEKLQTFKIRNSHLGLSEFHKKLSRYGTEFKIGMESSGVYHQGLLYHLQKRYKNVAVINPKRTKAHRKSLGYEIKTDPVDSYIISDYVKERDLSNNILPETYPFIKQLCRTRTKIVRQQTRLKNRINGGYAYSVSRIPKMFPRYFL